jgi:NAD(P)H-flavin reductase
MTVARIAEVWPEGARAHGVRLEVTAAWREAHRAPGQYVLVGEGAVPLALASAPGAPVELLLGADAYARLRPTAGDALPLSAPLGSGFDVARARGREVLVFGVGSAASAVRALVQYLLAARADHGRVRVYLGAHTAEDHAYVGEDVRWRAGGIELWRAVSKPWVQALFLAGDPPSADACVYYAGHDAGLTSLREALRARDLDPAVVLLNV